MKHIYILILLAPVILLCSCKKFLDVTPKGTLTENAQFSDVQGFRDAMYGVYATMAGTDMYGQTLSYDFLDKIGQVFILSSDPLSSGIANYDYSNPAIRSTTDKIWASYYTTLSYVNNVIAQAQKTTLRHADIELIKGEAHALRAFLHYDVLRLFADNYTLHPTAKGIPYAYTFDLNNKTLYSLQNTYKNILADLKIAEDLLQQDNAITVNPQNPLSDYNTGRYQHCNQFAVKAIKARVFYSMGNADSAAYYAQQVVDNKANFTLQDFSNFTKAKRFPAPGELIFGLNNNRLNDIVYSTFLANAGSSNNAAGRMDLATLYNTGSFEVGNTDVRFAGYYEEADAAYKFIRFIQNEAEKATKPITGINLIRLPEMYYILAECTYNKDKQLAASYLNQVRASRGLRAIDPEQIDTKEKLNAEMLQERMREMPGEGQAFFAQKHYNIPFYKTDGTTLVTPSTKIFVWPWPQNELDFGSK